MHATGKRQLLYCANVANYRTLRRCKCDYVFKLMRQCDDATRLRCDGQGLVAEKKEKKKVGFELTGELLPGCIKDTLVLPDVVQTGLC